MGKKYDYARLPRDFYTLQKGESFPDPRLVLYNEDLAQRIGWESVLSDEQKAKLFSGEEGKEDLLAMAYGGHQFGHYQNLGDGRALLLFEHRSPEGLLIDVQLKGSGRTPYSRRGDGRAVLGPMLREYLIGEAMFHLGVPTTRGLALVSTGEDILRDKLLPGAVLARTASSHLRVGTFEWARLQNNPELLRELLDYAVARHYPEAANAENRALGFFMGVMKRQVSLVAQWMGIGFIHGVMNTDNMAISGETIDYGPCAFMDEYDEETTFSSIDVHGRYSYGNQRRAAQWNLARQAEALLPLLHKDEKKALDIAQESINRFPGLFEKAYERTFRQKLGLSGNSHAILIGELLEWMEKNKRDFTNTFRDLSDENLLESRAYEDQAFHEWYRKWSSAAEKEPGGTKAVRKIMNETNPVVIPRNHLVERALSEAEEGDMSLFTSYLEILSAPYCDSPDNFDYRHPPREEERVKATFCGT